MKTRQQVYREQDSRTMMETPQYWRGNMLPLKKADQPFWRDGALGYLIHPEFGWPRYRVFLGTTFKATFPPTGPYEDYATVDALLAAGWVVD